MVPCLTARSGLALLLGGCSSVASPPASAPPASAVLVSAPPQAAAEAHAPEEAPDVTIDEAVRSRVIHELAAHLSAEYVFPDMAKQLGRQVTERHAAGGYAGATSALAFAKALTADLQPTSRDKHLAVFFRSEPPGDGVGGDASPAPFEPPRDGAIRQLQVLDGNIGYLQSDGVPPLVSSEPAIRAAFAFLAYTRALILDCRGNGGGDPHTVALYLSYLTRGAPFVINTFVLRDGSVQEFATRDLGDLGYGEAKPVFVLTSQHTFSGGEELAYDLQAMQRAVLVGEVTGGGANPTSGVPLGDSFVARMPFAHPVNPFTNANWEGVGVKPDLEVPAERALDVALDAARARLADASAAPQPKRASLPARRRPANAGVAVVGAGAGAQAARGPNLVKNGDFSSGMAPWGVMSFGADGPAPHPAEVTNGALCMPVHGGEMLFVGWPDDMYHEAFAIRGGAPYELSFRASASGRLPLRTTIKVGHLAAPWDAIVEADVPLDVPSTPFHVDFQSRRADDQAGILVQIQASPSSSTSEVCLDDFVLRETRAPETTAPGTTTR